MIGAGIIAILVSVALVLVRMLAGSTFFDRLLAANTIGNHIVVLIAFLAVLIDSPSYIDVALVYALVNFLATLVFLRYFKHGSLGGRDA